MSFSGIRSQLKLGSSAVSAGKTSIYINDYANAGPGSVLGGNLGTDAVAEFSILTTNYAAEYGRTSGGVISAITKTGTNQFHGSAYEFFRNDALDAANFFDNARRSFSMFSIGPISRLQMTIESS